MGAILDFGFLPRIIGVLPAIISFLPMVVKLVKLVEELFGAGQGPAKKSAVVELVRLAIRLAEESTGNDFVDDEDKLAESIGGIVEVVVQILKRGGQLGDNP